MLMRRVGAGLIVVMALASLGCATARPLKAKYSPASLAMSSSNPTDNDSVPNIPPADFMALAIRVELVSGGRVIAGGSVGADPYKTADLGPVPVGKYRLRVSAKCHPQQEEEVVVDQDRPELQWRLNPGGDVRFISEPTEVRRVNRAGQSEGAAQLAKNTKVRVLHRLPDASGSCPTALAEVTGDAQAGVSGRFIVAEARLAARSPMEVEAEKEAAAKGREAAAAEKAAQEKQRVAANAAERQKREDALVAAAAEESKSGRCRQDRYKLLQAAVELTAQFLGSNNSKLSVEDRAMAVANDKGALVRLKAGVGGKYHLFVVGVEPVALSVKDRQGYEIEFKSPFEIHGGDLRFQLGTQVWTASRQLLQVGTADTIAAAVKGRGCVGLMAVREWP